MSTRAQVPWQCYRGPRVGRGSTQILSSLLPRFFSWKASCGGTELFRLFLFSSLLPPVVALHQVRAVDAEFEREKIARDRET